MDHQNDIIIPDYTLTSEQDPNLGKNRVPTNAELVRLKALAGMHSRLLSNLKEEIRQAERAHDVLVAQYQQQIKELEGTQSTLHESKKALQLMHDQCSTIQMQNDRINGMTHPIRRYPPDLLQRVFQCIYDEQEESNRLQVTLGLSHVCKWWRKIVHDSPRLWSRISYAMHKTGPGIASFWDFVIPRMKAVPPVIVIKGLNSAEATMLKYCGLQRIPFIKILGVNLSLHNQFDHLHRLSQQLRGTKLEALEINLKHKEPVSDPPPQTIWDIGHFLGTYNPPAELHLVAPCVLRLTPSDQFKDITTLSLEDFVQVDLSSLLSLFSQLHDLRLLNPCYQHI
ncbi:hypothetical protein M408DRAFT_233258 [Serendipita vermifera MAFF 305830]|uniref:F-box domain-containing protein n=1 Tax=Serendipita vermifera MAFF 305830 TaxID=933852 RepID=A0A0C3AIB2_SERVB|nr:hypothetical protein M408DRAFT_233258 [Serendipita vermifera MAFF 305830]